MSEALRLARQAVLDSKGIRITLEVRPGHPGSGYLTLRMIHPDQYPIPFAEHWVETLFTRMDKHHIPLGDYKSDGGLTIDRWIERRGLEHLNNVVSGIEFTVHPVKTGQGEEFGVTVEGIDELFIYPIGSLIQCVHWRHFFSQNNKRHYEIEALFELWRQETLKKQK